MVHKYPESSKYRFSIILIWIFKSSILSPSKQDATTAGNEAQVFYV